MEIFHDYAYYYDSFYKDKNYKKEAATIKKLLDTYIGDEKYMILDMGCGTGKHDVELSRICKGKVTGIDISPGMIELARKRGGGEEISAV